MDRQQHIGSAASALPLSEARAAAHRAYLRAKEVGGLAPVLLDRLWSDTLLCAQFQREAGAAAAFRHTEHLCERIEERGRWR